MHAPIFMTAPPVSGCPFSPACCVVDVARFVGPTIAQWIPRLTYCYSLGVPFNLLIPSIPCPSSICFLPEYLPSCGLGVLVHAYFQMEVKHEISKAYDLLVAFFSLGITAGMCGQVPVHEGARGPAPRVLPSIRCSPAGRVISYSSSFLDAWSDEFIGGVIPSATARPTFSHDGDFILRGDCRPNFDVTVIKVPVVTNQFDGRHSGCSVARGTVLGTNIVAGEISLLPSRFPSDALRRLSEHWVQDTYGAHVT